MTLYSLSVEGTIAKIEVVCNWIGDKANEANKEIQKTIDFQNKVAIASIDSSCRGLKTYHDNIDSLANLNRTIVENMVPNLYNAINK